MNVPNRKTYRPEVSTNEVGKTSEKLYCSFCCQKCKPFIVYSILESRFVHMLVCKGHKAVLRMAQKFPLEDPLISLPSKTPKKASCRQQT